MKRAVLFLLLTGALPAQVTPGEKPAGPPPVLRVFQIKNADVNRLAAIIDVFGARVRPDPGLRVISVSGTPEQVKAIEDAIQRYDVPPPSQKNVELTFHLLQATPGAAPAADKLPAELEPVVKQLRATFAYQGYRVGDTILLRVRDGDRADASSTAAFSGQTAGTPNSTVQLRANRVTIGVTDKVAVIRIDNLNVGLRVPFCTTRGGAECTGWQYSDVGISTSVDIREGQKVVIGKTASGSDSAIIAVVTAKVVD